jgi:5'-nucleotidase
MTTILLTNDDGYRSEGILALFDALQKIGDVTLIAPEHDQSAVSHSLTMSRPLRVRTIEEKMMAVNGTPADCVAVALGKLMKKKPDLLVSGINNGGNLGDDITYSGTVSAAIEGTMRSIPSIAFSLADKDGDFTAAAQKALWVTKLALQKGVPADTLLNVNIPNKKEVKGVRITRQGRKVWLNGIQETKDPWGNTFYWIGGGEPSYDTSTDTDVYAISNDLLSITPIHLDKTNHEGIFQMKEDWASEL